MTNLEHLRKLIEAQRYAEAEQFVAETIRRQPANAASHYFHGVVLRLLGRLNDAERALQQALAIAPDFTIAQEERVAVTGLLHGKSAQEMYRDALHLEDLEQWENAELLMKASLRLEPQNQVARVALRTLLVMRDLASAGMYRFTRRPIKIAGFAPSEQVRFNRRQVPVFYIEDPGQYREIVEEILKTRYRHTPVFFRGQEREWSREGDIGEEVSLEPAGFRRDYSPADLDRWLNAWRITLSPFLGELAEPPSATFILQEKHKVVFIRPPQPAATGCMIGLMWQPELLGTMQHYGFPTDFLDITPDPSVALWFALHAAKLKEGAIRFHRKREWSSAAPKQWPVVYVLLPFRGQVVNLTDGYLSRGSPLRVQRQSAALVSYTLFNHPMLNPVLRAVSATNRPATVEELFPELALVLRLRPGKEWTTIDLPEQDWYFPQDDAIYRELLDRGAPHVARYSATA